MILPAKVFTKLVHAGISVLCLDASTGCTASLVPRSSAQPPAIAQDRRGRDLLYVSYGTTNFVGVYTFPGLKERGVLQVNFGGLSGLCENAAGDVFTPFLGGYGGTDEFAHGGQAPIAYLSFPYQYAQACAVDPLTGSLAVTGGFEGSPTGVAVYRYKPHRGWRLGRSYVVPGFYAGKYCGYDATGDLFCDGTTSKSGGFELAELAAKSSSFVNVALSQQINAPGQIQWDGTHLAIGDEGIHPSVVYQFTVNSSALSEAGETILHGSAEVQQFTIFGNRIIAPDPQRSCGSTVIGCVTIYRYPAGGSAVATLPLSDAKGSAISTPP